MSIEFKDLTGLSQPLTKLVEVVSSAIGSSFRPMQIRREADAKAYETVTLAKATAEATAVANEISIFAKRKTIEQLAEEHPEIAERAKKRLLTKEIEGQLNIESIAQMAAAELPAAVPDQAMNQDWRRKFFSEAENICEHDMQMLWGKVLAGEIAQPGQFSLRTLDTLRQLSPIEAQKFAQICSLAMRAGWVALPGDDINKALAPFGIAYNDLMLLRDAGLLMEGDTFIKTFAPADEHPSIAAEHNSIIINNGLQILLSWVGLARPVVRSLIFTNAGKELQTLMKDSLNEAYLKALVPHLRAAGFSKIKRSTETVVDSGHIVMSFDLDL